MAADWIRTTYDVEAQGLRRAGQYGRSTKHALRMSEIAWQTALPGGQTIGQQYYTDLLNPEMLEKYGVTLENTGLKSGFKASEMILPERFLREMTKRAEGPMGFWDKGILAQDNPLHDIFRRHVQVALTNPQQLRKEPEVVRELLEDVIHGPVDPRTSRRMQQFGLRGTQAKRELAAWNLTYDAAILESAARKGRFSHLLRELEGYREQGRFRNVDLRSRWSEFTFNAMRDDPSFAPRYTSYRKVNILKNKLTPGVLPSDQQLLELTEEHTALREFVDDWFTANQEQKAGRASKIWKSKLAPYESHPVTRKVVQVLETTSAGGTFADYERATVAIRRLAEQDPRAAEIIDKVWRPGQHHMSILGKPTPGREVTGVYDTAFNYVLGGKQSHLVERLGGIKNEAGHAVFPNLAAILKSQKYQAHTALSDVMAERAMVELFEDLNRPGTNRAHVDFVREALREGDYVAAGVRENLRNRGIIGGGARAPIAPPTGPKGPVMEVLSKYGKRVFKDWRTGIAASAVIGGGLYLLAERNKELEGIRQPTSIWTEVEGINPSGDMRSDFQSGRNPISQLLGTPYSPQVQWLPAGQLGMRGDHLYRAILEDSPEGEPLRKGAWVGRAVAAATGARILGSEKYVSDPTLGVHGYIDILLQGGIPMEVKTVASVKRLKSLKEPKRAAISQANFYAYAMGAPYSYVAYFARDDPSQFRLFRVDKDVQRLLTDRQVILQAYETAVDQGFYQPSAGAKMRILQPRGFEKVWHQFKSHLIGPERLAGDPGLYPRAQNGFETVAPLGDYGKHKRAVYRQVHHGGMVQQMHEAAKGSKIRDQRTRLQRVHPMMTQTARPKEHFNASRYESR